MARLGERIAVARQALAHLDELAGRASLSLLERDAAIQRFEYSFEAVWKAAQLYLSDAHGLLAGSPKQTARLSLQVGVFTESEARAALRMADDRNQTVHTYNEAVANEIAARLGEHAALLRAWLDRIEEPPT